MRSRSDQSKSETSFDIFDDRSTTNRDVCRAIEFASVMTFIKIDTSSSAAKLSGCDLSLRVSA